MEISKCIECSGEIEIIPGIMVGEVITCPDCSTDLEVIGVNPIKFDIAPTPSEDWGE